MKVRFIYTPFMAHNDGNIFDTFLLDQMEFIITFLEKIADRKKGKPEKQLGKYWFTKPNRSIALNSWLLGSRLSSKYSIAKSRQAAWSNDENSASISLS